MPPLPDLVGAELVDLEVGDSVEFVLHSLPAETPREGCALHMGGTASPRVRSTGTTSAPPAALGDSPVHDEEVSSDTEESSEVDATETSDGAIEAACPTSPAPKLNRGASVCSNGSMESMDSMARPKLKRGSSLNSNGSMNSLNSMESLAQLNQGWLSEDDLALLPRIWSQKLVWGFRTGAACGLGALYAVLTMSATWQSAVALAPVLAIVAAAGPSLGATMLACRNLFSGSVYGAMVSIAVVQLSGLASDPQVRTWVAFVLYSLAALFMTSREKWSMTQRKLSCVFGAFGVCLPVASGWSLPWYWPFPCLIPTAVAMACALLAMLIPIPRPSLAVVELRGRLRFQAIVIRSLTRMQHEVIHTNRASKIATAEEMLDCLEENVAKMKGLLPLVDLELLLWPHRACRLRKLVGYFDVQKYCYGGRQGTLRDRQGPVSESHRRFVAIFEDSWQVVNMALSEVTADAVEAERLGREADQSKIEYLVSANEQLSAEFEDARKALYTKDSAVWVEEDADEQRNLLHCGRVTNMFFTQRLVQTVCDVPGECAVPGQGWCGAVVALSTSMASSALARPSRDALKDAVKKTLALQMCALLLFVPSLREREPQALWASLTVAFTFSETVGDALSTGLLRLGGTMFGSMFALLSWELTQRMPLMQVCLVLALTCWACFCGLFRGSTSYAYQAVCAAFTAPIVLITMLSADMEYQAVAFQSIKMNMAGAAVFVLIENVLWRKSARLYVREAQAGTLEAIRESLLQAVAPVLTEAKEDEGSECPWAAERGSRPEDVASMCSADDMPIRAEAALRTSAAAASLLKAASDEPELWRPPFPKSIYEQAILGELRALRVSMALHAAVRGVPACDLPEQVRALLKTLAEEADKLEVAAKELRDHGSTAKRFQGELEGNASLRELASAARKSRAVIEVVMTDLSQEAEQCGEVRSNNFLFSVMAILFICNNFGELLRELAHRLRTIEAQEARKVV